MENLRQFLPQGSRLGLRWEQRIRLHWGLLFMQRQTRWTNAPLDHHRVRSSILRPLHIGLGLGRHTCLRSNSSPKEELQYRQNSDWSRFWRSWPSRRRPHPRYDLRPFFQELCAPLRQKIRYKCPEPQSGRQIRRILKIRRRQRPMGSQLHQNALKYHHASVVSLYF